MKIINIGLSFSLYFLASCFLSACQDTLVTDKSGGFSVQPAPGFNVLNNGDEGEFIQLASSDSDTYMSVYGMALDDISFENLVQKMIADMKNNTNTKLGSKESISINDYSGYSMALSGNDDGQSRAGKLVILNTGRQMFMMMANADSKTWQDSVANAFEITLNSVALFTPSGR